MEKDSTRVLWRLALVSARPAESEAQMLRFRSLMRDGGYEISFKAYVTLSKALKSIDKIRLRPDAILWDIESTPPDSEVSSLRDQYREIPLIAISLPKQFEQLGAIVNLDLRGYLYPASTEDPVQVQNSLNRLVGLVSEYIRWRTSIESNSVDGIITKTDSTASSTLADQIDFLRFVSEDKKLAPLFPRVIQSWNHGDKISYEMDYHMLPSVKSLLLDQVDPQYSQEITHTIFTRVLDVAFSVIYSAQKTGPPDPSFLHTACVKKLNERLAQSLAIISNRNRRKEPPEFKKAYDLYSGLLNGKQIVYDSEVIENPKRVVDQLTDMGAFSELNPTHLCLVHGDMHFDNILVRLYPEPIKLIFVDPRGFRITNEDLGVYDPAYDLGKLLHSAQGEYDFITSGFRTLEVSKCRHSRTSIQFPSITDSERVESRKRNGASTAATTSYRKPMKPWLPAVYSETAAFIRKYIEKRQIEFGDKHLGCRAELYSAFHLLTTGPAHLGVDPTRALALYLNGARALWSFKTKYYHAGTMTA